MSGSLTMRRLICFCRAAAVVALLVIAVPFSAQAACSLTSTTVLFGSYDIFSSTPLDTLGQIIFRCANNDHNISISLDKGGAPTFDPRRLLNGANTLNYNLYLDAARTTIWGMAAAGHKTSSSKIQPTTEISAYPFTGAFPRGKAQARGTTVIRLR